MGEAKALQPGASGPEGGPGLYEVGARGRGGAWGRAKELGRLGGQGT